jgi:hypothetical protein
MGNIYHEVLSQYNTAEDLQHAINAWSKLGFIVTSVRWRSDNNIPEYNINGESDNTFIRKVINKLQEVITTAHETGDFKEVLMPYQLSKYIQAVDTKEATKFYNKYFNQLTQLEHYINDKDFFQKPMINFTNTEEKTNNNTNEKEVKKTKEKTNMLYPTDDELIATSPRGVTNQCMIPAIQKYVSIKDTAKLQILKEVYPTVFEGSRKYLPKKTKEYLQKQNI